MNGTPYLLEYTYDSNQQRNYSKLRNMNNPGTPLEERWYEHGLETVRHNGQTSNTHKMLYVEGGDGLCAIIAVGPTTTLTPYAVYKDHLGSIVTVNKPTGGGNSQIYVEQNFDAWGRHRNPATWAYAEPVLPPWLFRGYTGHEHVWPFTLTNMNGRMYDPLSLQQGLRLGTLRSMLIFTHRLCPSVHSNELMAPRSTARSPVGIGCPSLSGRAFTITFIAGCISRPQRDAAFSDT